MLELIQRIIYDVTGKKNVTYDTDFVRIWNLPLLT